MAITDLQISDTLETSAPSIRYEGNEGPKSPEEQRMAQLQQEYMAYVFEQKEIGSPVMSFEEWYQMVYEASRMGVDAGQQPQGEMMRAPAAYGGIMDLGGRRRYGFGSIKKRIRKLIPNEAARVAEVAAPFVAPFNPIAAGLMSGVGGFDRHGSISKGLKSGLMNYAGGQAARYLGGGADNLQKGFGLKINPGGEGIRQYFSSPYKPGSDIFSKTKERFMPTEEITKKIVEEKLPFDWKNKKAIQEGLKKGTSGIMKFIDNNAKAILLGSMGLAAATATPQDMQEAARASRGTGMDIDSIREEVRVALADPTGEKWTELQKKYPYMGEQSTKKAAEGGIMRLGYENGGEAEAPWWKFWGGAADPEQPTEDTTMVEETITKINERALATARQAQEAGIPLTEAQEQLIRDAQALGLAYGGRARYYAGGQSTPSDYTIEDAIMATTQDKMGGITDIMKQSDLYRQGSVGQMYAAQGGRIGAQEGGLMDLGGMEKDYRNDGGFVPIGGEEKADDVPARLSKNEFVFTADAVRGAGGGDIDKGAEIMENIMKHLEQGGQISEETQGLAGAREKFDVSERLSEVV